MRRWSVLWGLLVAVVVLLPGLALAEATVSVEVRSAKGQRAEGTVTLEARGASRRFTCTTRAGRCRIQGVPGGRYVVRLAPKEGKAPPPRTVVIPPQGEVSLIVSAR